MTLKFLDLSGKIQPYEEIFREIIRVTSIQEISFFVIGAIARDLIMGFYSIESKRLTEDVDCGIQLASWQQFGLVKDALIQGEQFTADLRVRQRLCHWNGIKIDIVPFGAIEEAGEIAWPPDGEVVMVTLGIEEAHKDTVRVRFANDVEVAVASLPGLALMKLIAWNDQPYRRGRDAVDLGFIMSNYLDAGNADRILGEYADHADLLTDDFDHYLTGSRLLGRDVGSLLTKRSHDPVVKILEVQTGEQSQYPLIQAMLSNFHGEFDVGLGMLESFRQGIIDVRRF